MDSTGYIYIYECTNTYMHKITIDKKQRHAYMGGFGGRKEKGEIL